MIQQRVAVLILGHNHKEHLKDALDAVIVQTYSNYDVIYIDNASSDGSADFVSGSYPTVEVIENYENLGYAGGYDIAIRRAFDRGYDAVVLLNPDTIADHNWLAELVGSAYASPNIALAQSKVLIWQDGPTTLVNSFGNKINFLGFGYCGHYREMDSPELAADQDVSYASGSSLLIKKEYYPSKISFDADYFAYLEDQDLGWQARILGLNIVASARSRVWHRYDFRKENLSGFKFFLLERNRAFFVTKFFSLRLLCLILPAFLLMETGVIFDSLRKGYFGKKVNAYRQFLHFIPNMVRKRRVLQRIRVVPDKALLPWLSPTIDFEEVDSPLLRVANQFLKGYYSAIKHLL